MPDYLCAGALINGLRMEPLQTTPYGRQRCGPLRVQTMKQFQHVNRVFPRTTGQNYARSKPARVPVYRVGEPLICGRREWHEGAQFIYSPSGLELTLFRRDVGDDVVTDVMRGPAEFAMIVDSPLIVLAYRFGESIPWNDSPYSYHLQPADWQVIPSLDHSPEARALAWISLVGARDGIIHAQRGMTLSPVFTSMFHQAVRAQAIISFDPQECTSAISRLYLNHSSVVDRLSLAVVRSMGNE